jgi:prophage tail gpP-like protein
MGDLGSLDTKIGAGEFGTMTMRVEGIEINIWSSYSYNSHYLTPADQWAFEVGDEEITPELRKFLVPGNKVEFFIDDTKQATGYIDDVNIEVARNGGLVMHISGRDTMSPLIDSQIDPSKIFPEKIKLQALILDLIADFGFDTIEFASDADLKLGKKKKPKIRKKKGDKFLGNFPIPKKKPSHNDTYFGFISRITQRYGLWCSPTVDGTGLILDKPDYDQDPDYAVRRKRTGIDNNIISGGVKRSGTDQPSFIMARGDIPGRSVSHTRTRVIIDNPYVAGLGLGLSMQEQDENQLDPKSPNFKVGALDSQEAFLGRNSVITDPLTGLAGSENIREYQTFLTIQQRVHTSLTANQTFTTVVPVKPLKFANTYATKISRPRYIKDPNAHTIEELTNFAKREMSLCTRKAFVAHYEFMGHTIDGVIPQVNTIVAVDDEIADCHQLMWIQSRTFLCSRQGGCTVSIECLPLNSIFF